MTKATERQYATLVRVLDGLRSEAPANLTSYHTKDQQGVVQARSRAFIHLFLKARFGLTEFDKREGFITDGAHDGGVDAYFIDRPAKLVHIIQSKFKATPSNFVGSNISADDLIKMDVRRILRGEQKSENGVPYNDKIKRFQRDLRKVPDIGSYTHSVVILGNAKQLSTSKTQRLVGGYLVEQFDHARAYSELLFPVVNGTYYSDPNLVIEIQRKGAASGHHLDYDVKVDGIKVNVKLLYVPTLEI